MPDCANPLLLQWVGEWLEEAKSRNSKGVKTYKTAFESLKVNPIPFSHPSQARQLTGFGEKLCARLTIKMENFCKDNNLPPPDFRTSITKNKRNTNDILDHQVDEEDEETRSPPKKQIKTKLYVPKYRSGGYGLILALGTLSQDPPTYLGKQEAIVLAQPHCDSSYTAPSDPTKTHTAWSSMKTLLDKQLVHERKGATRKYALTNSGWECARSIRNYVDTSINCSSKDSVQEIGSNKQNTRDLSVRNEVPDVVPDGKEVSSAVDLPDFEPIVFEPGSFSVEMILDNREVRSKTDRDYVEKELRRKGINPLKRNMALGDITWVAKLHDSTHISNPNVEGDEIILDYIVERKRLDDLISSIKDKRFHEQKFRLGRSGIKNVIYIIEDISIVFGTYSKMEEAVQSAIAATQVVNGYFVKFTQKLDETIEYLASMNRILKEKYEGNPLHLIPTNVLTTTTYLPLLAQRRKEEPEIEYRITYPAFACLMSKSETLVLRDLYLKMLMCIKGVTGEKALEIQKRWKSPYELACAYRNFDKLDLSPEEIQSKKMKLISTEMNHLIGRKKIGQALSATIYEIWGKS